MIENLLNYIIHRSPHEQALRQLKNVNICAGELVIDAGANIGEISQLMSSTGAEVYAFEPNPHAYQKLKERFNDSPKVHCIEKGVADQNGELKLYLHVKSDDNEVYWSTGSSVLPFKDNVLETKYLNIQVVDLCEFMDSLDKPVKVLKLDIEGAECTILKRIILEGYVNKIEHIFVETHDDKIPELKIPTNEIRLLIANRGIVNINLDWE